MKLSSQGYAHGKLMITGEYLVMQSALSLSVPLNKGQSMSVSPSSNGMLEWQASDVNGVWFNGVFSLPALLPIIATDESAGERLHEILLAIRKLNPQFLADSQGLVINTHLEFNRKWGLGSSSSLIALLAEFAGVDALQLHQLVSNGSGYDVVCAMSEKPLLFQRTGDKVSAEKIDFYPPFSDNLLFVYLETKQNSATEVNTFLKKNPEDYTGAVNEISEITRKILTAGSIEDFSQLLSAHENIMSDVLNRKAVKDILFSDFQGAVKSLGAWGGDFVLASTTNGKDYASCYFSQKGFSTVFSYDDIVLSEHSRPFKELPLL